MNLIHRICPALTVYAAAAIALPRPGSAQTSEQFLVAGDRAAALAG